jgi:trk system potassium uptake protein TrkA
MKVIIIGDGNVGYYLAENLSRDGNDVTIIDKDAESRRSTVENLDVRYIKGNGASAATLIDAGVRKTDLLIASTSGDEMNMVCCLTAKRLGTAHTVARIRDPEYADELAQLQEDLGLDMIINPEMAIAGEIVKLLEFTPALSVETFAGGRVDMVEIKVLRGMPISDMKLKAISREIFPSILIGAILRGDEVIIPNGESVLLEGDIIYIVGRPSNIFRFCALIGLRIRKIKNVMIVGGGRVCHYLARSLDEMGIGVKIIENDYDRCMKLAESLPRALVINGDGSDDNVLRSENIGGMGAFVSVTDKDEENLMTALLAKRMGVPKVVAEIRRPDYAGLLSDIGLDNLVCPNVVTANYISRYVRGLQNAGGSTVNTLHRIIGDKAEAIEFTAGASAKLLGIPLKKLRIVEDVLVVVIVRKNSVIIPHGDDSVNLHDNVILMTRGLKLTDLNDILDPSAPGHRPEASA